MLRTLIFLRSPAVLSAGLMALILAVTPITSDTARASDDPEPVTFGTEDGLSLAGTWYGEAGNPAVILSHMRPDTQDDWAFFARRLAELGYRAFTFDFRGHGGSGGSPDPRKTDVDLRAALQYVRNSGATDVVLIGGSMGAMATAKLAAEETVLAAVLMAPYWDNETFAGPTRAEARAITSPLLVMTARDDSSAAESREIFEAAGADGKHIKVFSGGDHGRRLLIGRHAVESEMLILGFLAAHAPVGR